MMRVVITGMQEVTAALNRIAKLPEKVRGIHSWLGYWIAAEARVNTPVGESGELFASIFGFPISRDATMVGSRGSHEFPEFGTGARGAASYTKFFEGEGGSFDEPPTFAAGWAGMNAQPHIRPAVKAGIEKMLSEIETDIETAL